MIDEALRLPPSISKYLSLETQIRQGYRSRQRKFDPFTGLAPNLEGSLANAVRDDLREARGRDWNAREFSYLGRRVGAVVGNHLIAARNGTEVFFPRGHSGPGASSVGQPAFGGRKPMVKIIDGLSEAGYLTLTTAPPGTHGGIQSTFVGTDKLSTLMRSLEITEKDIDQHLDERPAIIIRERKTKQSIRLPNCSYIQEMYTLVRRYNTFHLKQDIVFPDGFGGYKNVFTPACRIFSNGLDCKGGRFYRGYWLCLTGKGNNPERSRILINGNRVVEVDFSAFQPRLLYHIAKLDCPDDPYHIPWLVDRLSGLLPLSAIRLLAKLAMVIMINRRNKRFLIGHFDKLEASITEEIKDTVYAEVQNLGIPVLDIFDACENYHAPIAHMFYESWGLDLMYLESQIAEKIINKALDKGIAILPVHDSFIVQYQHEEWLRTTMKEEYYNVVRNNCIIK